MGFEKSARPLARCLQCTKNDRLSLPIRSFTTSRAALLETTTTEPAAAQAPPPPASTPAALNPELVSKPAQERRLISETGQQPVASRRRRHMLKQTQNIPFEQLPFQCFQEARKVLQQDRMEKVEEIKMQRERIEKLEAEEVAPQNESQKNHRLRSMRERLEHTKILADINDPIVKKTFEDKQGMSLIMFGLFEYFQRANNLYPGDMNKPIYRHLADKKWRSYKRQVLVQRLTQMNVVPDVMPAIDPVVSTTLMFGRRKVQHGEIVDSRVSEIAPAINIQPYDAGERLYTIAVIDPDVPNVETDGYDFRCHYLASNIRISPTETMVRLGDLSAESQVILPWLAPYSQKGIPYQRLALVIMEQPAREAAADAAGPRSQEIDVAKIKAAKRYTKRHNFILRSFATTQRLKPVGADLFRTTYDEGTAGVMERAGIPGGDVEFKRKKVEPLPYKRLKGSRYR